MDVLFGISPLQQAYREVYGDEIASSGAKIGITISDDSADVKTDDGLCIECGERRPPNRTKFCSKRCGNRNRKRNQRERLVEIRVLYAPEIARMREDRELAHDADDVDALVDEFETLAPFCMRIGSGLVDAGCTGRRDLVEARIEDERRREPRRRQRNIVPRRRKRKVEGSGPMQ